MREVNNKALNTNHHMSLMRILLHHNRLPLEGVLSVEC